MRSHLILLSFFLLVPLAVAESETIGRLLADQGEQFRNNNPDEAKFYRVLAPISPDYTLRLVGENHAIVRGLINRLRVEPNDLSQRVSDLVDKFETTNDRLLTETREELQSLALLTRETDRWFYFKFARDLYRDSGILVIRNGQIVYRRRYEWSHFPGSELPNDHDVEFNRLDCAESETPVIPDPPFP